MSVSSPGSGTRGAHPHLVRHLLNLRRLPIHDVTSAGVRLRRPGRLPPGGSALPGPLLLPLPLPLAALARLKRPAVVGADAGGGQDGPARGVTWRQRGTLPRGGRQGQAAVGVAAALRRARLQGGGVVRSSEDARRASTPTTHHESRCTVRKGGTRFASPARRRGSWCAPIRSAAATTPPIGP
eukprot:6098076-Pyramimonas_sp.AAC.3